MNNVGYKPMQTAVYLVVLGEQNEDIFIEFEHSLASLRRFHPELLVYVYHQNLSPRQLERLRELPLVMGFPIAVDNTGRYAHSKYRQAVTKVRFPELDVMAAKLDAILLSPGDSLYLDTDTEVRAPLDDCFNSSLPWMHLSEGLIRDQKRDYLNCLRDFRWEAFGWRGDWDRLKVYNAGVIWLPQDLKGHLFRAKELLWSLTQIPSAARGGNRLDEQLVISLALQEAAAYQLGEIGDRVYHYYAEKYNCTGPVYDRVYGPQGITKCNLPGRPIPTAELSL